MENLLRALEGKISLKDVKGIIYRTDEGIVTNEPQPLIQDISTLPWPARDLLVQKKYKIALMSTSRGCISNCTFLRHQKILEVLGGRPIQDVADEIEYIYKTYGINVFYFIDCSFENPDISYERLETFAKEILKCNIPIYYLAFFRPDFARRVKPELVELLYQSGHMGALIGIESHDEKSLKIYNKKTSPSDNTMVIDLFRSHNIHVDIGFIMFHPFSQFEGLHKNIDFLEKQGFACIINFVVSPYIMSKDCALFHKIKKHGLIVDEEQFYGYHYADPKIEVLVKYIESFFKKTHSPKNVEVFSMHRSLTTLAYWKRIYKHDERLTTVFHHTEEKYITEKDKLNFHIAAWFRNLLYLSEQNWNEDKANAMTAQYLGESFLQDISEKIAYARYLLNLQISRCGIDLQPLPFVEQM